MNYFIVRGTDSKTYLGKSEDAPETGKGVVLQDAWEVVTMDQLTPQNGIQRVFLLLPIAPAEKSIPSFHLEVSGWYDVEASGNLPRVQRLISQAAQAENQKPSVIPVGPAALQQLENMKRH